MQMLLYFPLFYKNRQWANQLCSWIIFIQLYISAIIAWYFWQLYMQRWNVQYKLTYCTVLLWRIFISLCVFSQYLYFCQRHPHACARAVFLSTHSAFVSMGHCFFSAFQRVTVSGISWLAKPSVQTLDFNLVLFLFSTMLPVFTINYTCFLNLFTEVWLGKSHVL